MHKLAETPITRDCFLIKPETYYLEILETIKTADNQEINFYTSVGAQFDTLICQCEALRQKYLETKDVRYWRALIELLPESWCQTRTVTLNYENLLSICKQRRNHKLPEWREDFINWARDLPYAQDLIFLDEIAEDKNS